MTVLLILPNEFLRGRDKRRYSTTSPKLFHHDSFERSHRFTSSSSTSSSRSSNDKSPVPSSSLPLGHPIPLDEHACSVSLPTWSSIVGYEEGSREITSQLACGYPRFVFHPYVVELMDYAILKDGQKQQQQHQYQQNNDDCNLVTDSSRSVSSNWDCIILPTQDAALRCHDYLIRACGYYDGCAKSPRISSNRSFVGDIRIPLFFDDNAFACSSITATSCVNNTSTKTYASASVRDQQTSKDRFYYPNNPVRVLNLDSTTGIHAVIFPARTEFAVEAKSYWQHTGEVVSSRMAEVALTSLGIWSCSNDDTHRNKIRQRVTTRFFQRKDGSSDDDGHKSANKEELPHGWSICPYSKEPHLVLFPSSSSSPSSQHKPTLDDSISSYSGIMNRIASITGVPSNHVFLTPSGMSSIYHALRSARRHNLEQMDKHSTINSCSGGTSIVYGFPYLDTLKLCSRTELVPGGVKFFGYGNDKDMNHLEQLLRTSNTNFSILLTEYPSNPLLNCPDLHKLRTLADRYNFALVVDDTIGNFANLNLLESGLADAVCTSLTKLFNGRGDAMAGSIITNPNTKMGRWMQDDLQKYHIHFEGLWKDDARAIYVNSESFFQRSSRINETAEALADWLLERDEVETVYYPKFTCKDGYDSVKDTSTKGGKHTAGYGGLMSILLRPHICQRTFYDQIDVCKGPR